MRSQASWRVTCCNPEQSCFCKEPRISSVLLSKESSVRVQVQCSSVVSTQCILQCSPARDSSFSVGVQVHERHLNTDILLALMRALLLQRPDLRVILMSATINVQAYSDYFGGAPIIQASPPYLSIVAGHVQMSVLPRTMHSLICILQLSDVWSGMLQTDIMDFLFTCFPIPRYLGPV